MKNSFITFYKRFLIEKISQEGMWATHPLLRARLCMRAARPFSRNGHDKKAAVCRQQPF